ncbi:MAG: hypothetical protein WCK67_06565 [bacterium]
MANFDIKTIIPVESGLSIKECEQVLLSDKFCLGIINKDRELFGFVLKEDLDKALAFELNDQPISLIITLAECVNIQLNEVDEKQLQKNISFSLNKGVFIGEDNKTAKNLAVLTNCETETNNLSLRETFEKQMSAKFKKAIDMVYLTADKYNIAVYLVGGITRDLIISRKSFDTDICVEYNAIDFAKLIKKEYFSQVKIKSTHEEFKTAKIIFDVYGEEIEIDLASTRTEKYMYPAALPTLDKVGCCLCDDLKRRDFTINSMATAINKNNFGNLIDPLKGFEDIKNKKIRVLHSLSFIDDPTRILRGLKFRVRFGYELEENTRTLQENCLNNNIFSGIAGERVKSELKQTLNLNKADCLDKLFSENIYKLINKNLVKPDNIKELSKKCEKLVNRYKSHFNSEDFIWLIYLSGIILHFDIDKITAISKELYLSGIETEVLIGAKTILERSEIIGEAEKRYEIYEQMEGFFNESIIAAMVFIEDNSTIQNIELFLRELQNIKIHTTGKYLIEQGLNPGPRFGEILSSLLKAKINRELFSQEDELKYIKRLIEK